MKKWFGSVGAVFGLLLLVTSVRGQAVCTAAKVTHLQLGGGVLYLHSDYGAKDYGVTGWADANLNNFIGVEAEVHLGTIESPSDYGENSYLAGPRLMYRSKNGTAYGKAMVGKGNFIRDTPGHTLNQQYNIYALGVGLEHRISDSFSWRVVDAEYQYWKAFKPHGLSPYIISTGVMWNF
jgi:hypothetical protein